MLDKIKCAIVGHKWKEITVGFRHGENGALDPIKDEQCERCLNYKSGRNGLKWRNKK